MRSSSPARSWILRSWPLPGISSGCHRTSSTWRLTPARANRSAWSSPARPRRRWSTTWPRPVAGRPHRSAVFGTRRTDGLPAEHGTGAGGMLQDLELSRLDDLFRQVPDRLTLRTLNLPEALSEIRLVQHFRELVQLNDVVAPALNLLRDGALRRCSPALVDAIIFPPGCYSA